ncbi:Transmembrane protein [Sesamum angolense]|uniref:Transmembrane protein n=1 Tax=Sesamum angolense TaxID=2727404 RepID=A0AAE1WDI6_9LAMI|nr:Transmembrane protein [Sesamum angolense]
MMNVLALGLVLTSLVTAGFFNPSPEKQNPKEDVIVKEGHRVVVVEYEKDDGNTKVLISPQESLISHKFAENGNQEEEVHHRFSPGELVCDAYGKCKRIIASAMGKTKEAVERRHRRQIRLIPRGKEAVSEAVGNLLLLMQPTSGMQESAKEQAEKVKRQVYDAVDATKKVKEDAEREASRKMEGAKETVSEKAEEWMENASVDVFNYMLHREVCVVGILHLMGFAAAYGMCVWVTFASSYVLAGALPRQQFATVQSKIYPVYFKAMASSVGMALLGHLMMSLSQRKGFVPVSVGMFQGVNLMASLAMILVNLLFLEPRASKRLQNDQSCNAGKNEEGEGRRQRRKEGQATETAGRVVDSDSTAATAGRVTAGGTTTKENPEAAAAKAQINRLTATLQRLNSYSSFLNVLTLTSLTLHLAQLGQHLHTAC